MRRGWLVALAIFFAIVLSVALGMRWAAGAVVSSDEFREALARLAERALRPVAKDAAVTIRESGVVGLADVEVKGMRAIGLPGDLVAEFTQVRVEPQLRTFLWPGPVAFAFKAELSEGGHIDGTGTLVLRTLWGQGEYDEGLVVEGAGAGLDVRPLVGAIVASGPMAEAVITGGRFAGSFHIKKPLGSKESAGRRQCRFDIRVAETKWEAAGEAQRAMQLGPFQLEFTVQDDRALLVAPVVLKEGTNIVTIEGGAQLPPFADRDVEWNLMVTTGGESHGLPRWLGSLFRCDSAPAGPRITVHGPRRGPTCRDMP